MAGRCRGAAAPFVPAGRTAVVKKLYLLKRVTSSHPPAGATTLIISLGIVTRPFHLLIIEIAVVALCLQAIIINRRAGLDYPWWARRLSTGDAALPDTAA